MFISDFAIQRPIVTVTAMVALVVFGIFALLNLHTDEFPDIQQPVIGVTIVYPGASPSEVTREIIEPVEDAIFGISGVDGEKSTCSGIDGLATCTIFFDFEKPIQQASQDIRDAISTQRDDLPPEMEEPVLTRFDPSEEPVITMTLTSGSVPATTLSRLADPGVTRSLRAITGVAQVSVVGGIEREMTVELQPRGSGGRRCERLPGGAGAGSPEPGRSGRSAQRPAGGAHHPSSWPSRGSGRLREAGCGRAAGPVIPTRSSASPPTSSRPCSRCCGAPPGTPRRQSSSPRPRGRRLRACLEALAGELTVLEPSRPCSLMPACIVRRLVRAGFRSSQAVSDSSSGAR